MQQCGKDNDHIDLVINWEASRPIAMPLVPPWVDSEKGRRLYDKETEMQPGEWPMTLEHLQVIYLGIKIPLCRTCWRLHPEYEAADRHKVALSPFEMALRKAYWTTLPLSRHEEQVRQMAESILKDGKNNKNKLALVSRVPDDDKEAHNNGCVCRGIWNRAFEVAQIHHVGLGVRG
jgi:hypothetical protein